MHTGHVTQNTAVLAVIIKIKIKKLKKKIISKLFFLEFILSFFLKKRLTIDIALFILYVFDMMDNYNR